MDVKYRMSTDFVITNIQINHARNVYFKVVFVSIWQIKISPINHIK